MSNDFGLKNGDIEAQHLTTEVFRICIRIRLLGGEFITEPMTCSANNPPNLSEVLEFNSKKFLDFHPTTTGDVYGHLKRYDDELGEYLDMEPGLYPLTFVRSKDKIELWYSHVKQHPQAQLLVAKKDEPMEMDLEEAPVSVVPEIHLQIFKSGINLLQKAVPLSPGAQNTIEALIKHFGAECTSFGITSSYSQMIYGWILKKKMGENNYIEAQLDERLEEGSTYQLYFEDTQFMIKHYLTAYFVLSNAQREYGGLQLLRVEKHSLHRDGSRQEDQSNGKHQAMSKLQVFKNENPVLEQEVFFDSRTPLTFHDLICELGKKENLIAKDSFYPLYTYAWFFKVSEDGKLNEVNLHGSIEERKTYHLHFYTSQALIKRDVSAYFKLHYSGLENKKLQFEWIQRESPAGENKVADVSCGSLSDDLAKRKSEEIPMDLIFAPAQASFYLRIEKNNQCVAEEAMSFNPNAPHTFQQVISHLADHNVFRKSEIFRQTNYAWILKVVDDKKLIEVDLNGMVENGLTYHVRFADLYYEIEDNVTAVFKISYGGFSNQKPEFQLMKKIAAFDQKVADDGGICKLYPKLEEPALPAKREIYVKLFKNEEHLRDTVMPITRSDCPSFKSLLAILNKNWKIISRYDMNVSAWILKSVGENQYEEVDLDGHVEESATYQVHFATYYYCRKNVMTYFKIRCAGNEKLEFVELVVKRILRSQKMTSTVAGRLTPEDHVPSKKKSEEISSYKVSQSSYGQTDKDSLRFDGGEVEKMLKSLKVEDEKPRELPSILQNVALPSKIASDAPKAITIVLLGETGVGKSTLINGMVNYIAYSSLSEAESNKPKYLIPARFLYDGKKILIGEQNANENIQLDGESATQRPQVYEFTENEQLYRIIDVPGIGDSRGVEQDRKNFDYILEEINRHEEINAFCILIPPNGSRITVAMRYCIYELLSNLHKDAAKNIVFCFTKARSTFYKGGDTLPILHDYLKNLKRQQDVEIALDEDRNMFYFDNEPFKYLWMKANGIDLENQRKDFDRSFDVSRQSTVKLFDYVRNLPPHDTTAMKALTETRRLILNMVPISAAASKKIRMNAKSMEDQIEQLRCSRYHKKSLQDHLYMTVYDIKTTPLENPRTVCSSTKCTDQVPVGESGQFNVHYRQICHDKCFLSDVTLGAWPNVALKSCAAFGSSSNCRECGCSWERHLHIKHLQKFVTRQVVNKELKKMLANKDIQNLSIADVIRSYEVQLNELKEDEELIKKMSAKFSTFLRNNSMSIRNDVYADYLKHTLKMAEQELMVGGSYEKVAELKQSLRAYEQEVEFLMRAEKSSGPVIIAEIFELKKDLRALAERHGEIGDLLEVAEGGGTMAIEPVAAKLPQKPEHSSKEVKKPESKRVEDSSQKSNKTPKEGVKTYNRAMLKEFA